MRTVVNCLLSLILLAWLTTPGSCAADGSEPLQIRGDTMGTTYSIVIPAPPQDFDEESVRSAITDTLATINSRMSTYDPESELSRFNTSPTTEWFPVSRQTAEVVQDALEICRLSGGAYDISIEPLLNLWSFGASAGERKLPTPEEIADARSRTGFQHIHARLTPPTLRKEIPELTIDLSSIAKGYGVDRLAELLDDRDVSSYMIEIGGEVRTRGGRSSSSPWRIGLERPLADRREVHRVVPLDGQALATSGDYRQFFEINGQRYSHIIDPRSGQPVSHELASVSVIADRCAIADAWATTLMVLGPEAGAELAEAQGLSAFFVTRSESGFEEHMTAGFPPFVGNPGAAPDAGNPLVIFAVALGVFLLAVVGMAVGAMFRGRCLTGSCGGLANFKDAQGRSACEVCQTPSPECSGQSADTARSEVPSTQS